ncbi:MAG: PKD domain-containing protein, partial [Thermoplasmata archaeon]|nr:PKD domain-containing protein [Thermoplasmata archaeon]
SYFDFGDNTTSGWMWGLKISHSYEFSGDYIVELKVRDSFDAESDPITTLIHVNYPPTAQLTAEPVAGKVNELITFSVGNSEDIDGEIAEYYINFGDKQVSGWINDSMAYHMYTNVGAYYVYLIVRDNNIAISENNEYVRIDITEEGTPIAGKPPVAVLNVDSNTTYTSVNMMFDASSSYDEDGKVTEYYFDFGDGEISGWLLTPKTYHAFSMAGSYDVYLYVKDNTNSISYTSIEIQVELNQPPTPVFLSEPQYIGNSVFLMWTQNTDDDFYAYEVHASLISNFTPNLNTLRNIITDQPTPQCTLENVIKGYLYRVRVIDTGGYTADSNIVPTLGEGVAPPSEEVSDKTTITFSMSYISGSNTFISEETYIILRAPQDFPNAMIYYNIDNLGDNEYQGMFQLGQTSEGEHTLIYWSTAENWTETKQYKTIIYDASSPNLIITNPQDGSMIMNSSVEVFWDGSDNCGIKTYYIRLDDGNWIEAKENKYTLTKISDGEHIIYVKAEDNLGHSTIQTVKIKLDLSPPEVTLLSPTDGMQIETGNDIEVSWIASDKDAGIKEILLSIDGIQHSISVDSDSYTISNPSEGTHVIVLKVKDNAGNINAASTSFMVAEKEAAAEDEDDDLAVWGMFIIMIIILILIALIFIKTLKPKRQEPEKAGEPEPPSEITAPSSETPPASEESPQPPPQPQPEPKPAAGQPVEQRTSTESTQPQQLSPKPLKPQSPQNTSAPKILQKISNE